MIRSLIRLLFVIFLLSGCTGTLKTDQKTITSLTAEPQNSLSTNQFVDPAPARPSSNTPAPPAPSLPTLTPSPTPHPLQITALRNASYPGSPITIEKELEPGVNYRRFYAHYFSEGFKIYALLTIPNAAMPDGGFPAIVFNHGYIPPDQYRTTERYIAYVDQLARNGYIVFRIDYRGHDRSEGAPVGAYSDPGYLFDVLNAVSSLQQFPQANPNRIGMWGHSMGGYLTLRAMVISPDIKAGVIWAGVVGSYPDLVFNWHRTSNSLIPTLHPGIRRWREVYVEQFGTPEENPLFWESISANSFLADLSGPLQLHHGTSDTEVPVEFSTTLSTQAAAAGRQVELYTYEGDNHNLSGQFSTAMARTVAFYNQHLK